MNSVDRIAELALRKIQSKQTWGLEAIAAPSPPPPKRTFSSLHRTAAVMSSFLPEELKKLGGELESLLRDSAPLEGGAPGQWTLLPAARAAVLESMGDAEPLRAAIASAKTIASDDSLMRALDVFCTHAASPNQLDVAALATVAPLLPSLQKALPNAPTPEDTERRLEFLRLLQPFLRLVGDFFAGRVDEMKTLNEYVGVLAEGSTWESARHLWSERRAPLLLYGAGGVGKSTLVAKFILDHAELPEERRFPFAYLDFDRPALLASEPATILVETVRQIGLQYPVAYSAAQDLRDRWNTLLQESTLRRGPIRKQAQSADPETRDRILKDFVRFLSTLDKIRGPLLLVLDTFEEVQHQSDVYVRELAKFLDALGAQVPRLRVVLSGRGDDAPGIPLTTKIFLNEFDEDSGVAFLQKFGVSDPAVARAVVKQLGGNPLTLRLAASVVEGEGATKDGISDLETRATFGLVRARKEHIQGQLFRRILGHIKDPDLKKIADPGLILRRITADIIQKVLAEPCGIDVPTKERAEELFGKLRKEVALVSAAGAGALQYRSDVRRLALTALQDTRTEHAPKIHELAAAYYAQRPGAEERAEEIYHRLMLGEPHEEIARLFLDGVEPFLANAFDELPAPEKEFLAERLGKNLPPEARKDASDQLWERTAIRRVQEALEAGDTQVALAVLAERTARTEQTLLRAHEVKAYLAHGDLKQAARLASTAIEKYAGAGNLPGLFEVRLADAEISRRLGKTEEAMAKLDMAEKLVDTGEPIQRMRVLVARGLMKETPETPQKIVALAAGIDDDLWRDHPELIRLAASVSLDHSLMARAIRVTGLPRLRVSQRRILENYFDAPIDEEKVAKFVETPFPNSERFVLQVGAEILRNDTYAEGPREHEREADTGIPVEAEDWEIVQAMNDLRLSYEELGRILASFDYSIESVTFASDADAVLPDLVANLRKSGRLATFIDAVRRNAVTRAPDFLRYADRLGFGLTIEELRDESLSRAFLEELVTKRRSEIAMIESRICRIDDRKKMVGTGFLLVLDVVLACFDGAADLVRFDFGEKEHKVYSAGTFARVLTVKKIPNAFELPLVALRLDRPLAFEPVRGTVSSEPRGSFATPSDAWDKTVAVGQPAIWLWYDRGELRIGGAKNTLRSDEHQLGFAVRPRPSFAGAPVFDLDLNLVGIHAGAHPRLKRECIAYPITTLTTGLQGLLES
ncbi:MAG TPA: ATP-binding protein [Thermoanaerobaculia bacterium]|nr:ATP-binding protein [Thermoanaerobaculia bacterium]